jgi:hypothetical protein
MENIDACINESDKLIKYKSNRLLDLQNPPSMLPLPNIIRLKAVEQCRNYFV